MKKSIILVVFAVLLIIIFILFGFLLKGQFKELQFRENNGVLQWKYNDEDKWNDALNTNELELSCIDGQDGKDGEDGQTPTVEITEDGYWVINGEKTKTKAVGQDGKNGKDGKNGADGKDGVDGKEFEPTFLYAYNKYDKSNAFPARGNAIGYTKTLYNTDNSIFSIDNDKIIIKKDGIYEIKIDFNLSYGEYYGRANASFMLFKDGVRLNDQDIISDSNIPNSNTSVIEKTLSATRIVSGSGNYSFNMYNRDGLSSLSYNVFVKKIG